MADAALAGLRILECGDFVAAPYAATMLGHLGADVVKVEPPAGDSNRHRGPYPAGKAGIESSGLHLFLDQAKRSVVLDLDSETGRAGFRRLAAAADALIVSGSPASIRRRGLTYADLRDTNPALVVTTVTSFGLDAGPPELPMREICDLAATGWLSISPGALDDPALPPLKPFGQQAHFQAGVHAGIATLGALFARDATGLGQHVDISVQAAVAGALENGLMHYVYSGTVASRLGRRILGPWGIIQLEDGQLFLVCVTQDEWQRMLDYLGNPEWADSPLFADRLARTENNDALLSLIESELAGRGVQETYHGMQARRVPCTPINDMADVLASDHLTAREFLVEGDHPVAGRLIYPGAQWRFGATPWQAGRSAPLLGEHTGEVMGEWTAREAAPTPARSRRASGGADADWPLAGVRVADFTWVWAGPMATMQLAHLGADVIRIESSSRQDTVRSIPPMWQGVAGPNRSGYFNQYSQGKRGITLNLKDPRGLELAYEIVRHSDIVTDNYSAGAIERMGFGYDKLRQINPHIIQISMAGHGQTGPIARYVAYGPTQVPMIGLSSLTGYPGGGPREVGISYGDPNAGLHAALAVLAALRHRDRTGEGQYIDMSQWEAAAPLVVEGLLTYQMTGKQPPRMGNRDEFQAPQGVFPCRGEDQWLALSCWSDDEWQRLATVLGRSDLAGDAGLATAAARKQREPELEAAITAWTALRTPDQAAAELRPAGVPASPVLTTAEVANDAVLAARDFWVSLPHPECTGARQAGIPWRFSGTPLRIRRAAPTLGGDTAEVLRELAGLDDGAIEKLRADGLLA